MSLIRTYRDNVIATLKTAFLDTNIVRQVEKHGGLFDEKEVMRLCSNSPAIYVSVLNVPQKDQIANGQGEFDTQVGAYVFTQAEGQDDADDLAWGVSEAIAAMALSNSFATPLVHIPHSITIQNLWSRALDDMNTCIMAVGWCAPMLLGADLDALLMSLQVQTVGSPAIVINDQSTELGTVTIPDPEDWPPRV